MSITLVVIIQLVLFAIIWRWLRYLEDSINFTNIILNMNRMEFLKLKHKIETENNERN